MVHIVFSHGQESGPWGGKINHLAEIVGSLGCTFDSLDYRGITELVERVKLLANYLASDRCPEQSQVILVGSSMGACVSIAATRFHPVAGLFLLAPAFGLFDEWQTDWHPHAGQTALVHGWHDELIPAQRVFDWGQRHRCTVHLVDDRHRLLAAITDIGLWFREFVTSVGRKQSATMFSTVTGDNRQ